MFLLNLRGTSKSPIMKKYNKAENVALKYLNEWIDRKISYFPEFVLTEYLSLYSTTPQKDVSKLKKKAVDSLCDKVNTKNKKRISYVRKRLSLLV